MHSCSCSPRSAQDLFLDVQSRFVKEEVCITVLLSCSSNGHLNTPILGVQVNISIVVFLLCRIQGTRVQAKVGELLSTRSDSWLSLLWLLRLWTLPGAQLEGVATSLSHPQILPQAMVVCQWLLRMWCEWEQREHVQHKPSVSQFLFTFKMNPI